MHNETKIKEQEFRHFIRRLAAGASPTNDSSLTGVAIAGIALLLEGQHPHLAQDVFDFHKKYEIEYEGPCRFIPKEDDDFRNKRLEEELLEYQDAKTLEEKLDALVDLIYIALGNAHLHGFTVTIFNEAWRRVQAANMAKERAHKNNPGKFGSKIDIVKPKGWLPPDHSDLIASNLPPVEAGSTTKTKHETST